MISQIIMCSIMELIFIVWYSSIKKNSVKTVGICKKNLDSVCGFKGKFEYEFNGIKYCSIEKYQHIGRCKVDKKYTIYVDKRNNSSVVSIKQLVDLMFFMIMFLVAIIFSCIMEITEVLFF